MLQSVVYPGIATDTFVEKGTNTNVTKLRLTSELA